MAEEKQQNRRRLSASGTRLFRNSLELPISPRKKKYDVRSIFNTFAFSRNGEEIISAYGKLKKAASWALRSKEGTLCDVIMRRFGKDITVTSRRILQKIHKLQSSNVAYDCFDAVRGATGRNEVLVTGCGPVGLRTACELALIGCHVTLIEKRSVKDAFNRYNILHLWNYTAHDLAGFAVPAKELCGDDQHIGTNTVQTSLLRAALLLGVHVRFQVEYVELVSPKDGASWAAKVLVNEKREERIDFDVVVGCGGARDRLSLDRAIAKFGPRSKYRSGTAIGVVCMYYRKKPSEGPAEFNWSAHFNRKLFDKLEKEGMESENVVYYKDPHVHYLVFTPTLRALASFGVVRSAVRDENDRVIRSDNVDEHKLLAFVTKASKIFGLPVENGLTADPGIFDFSERTKGEESIIYLSSKSIPNEDERIRGDGDLKSKDDDLADVGALAMLAGDSLMEPFWPEGLGMNRGFLSALDTAWAVRAYALGASAEEVVKIREGCYFVMRDLAAKTICQVCTKMLQRGKGWSIDPSTRYSRQVYPPSRAQMELHRVEARARRENRKNRDKPKREDPRANGGFIVSSEARHAISKMKLRGRFGYLNFEISPSPESALKVSKKGLKAAKLDSFLNSLPANECRFSIWTNDSKASSSSSSSFALVLWTPLRACATERKRYVSAVACARKLFCAMKPCFLRAKRKDAIRKKFAPPQDDDEEEDAWLDDF